jgi:hypothetical protein
MWIAVPCIGLGMLGFASGGLTAGSRAPTTAKHAVLEIMSPDSDDLALQLVHHWGGMSASHVFFDNHDGPFDAVVEASAGGVRVTFTGWEEYPFVATAAKIRMAYDRPGAARVEFVAEAIPGGEVRIRPVGKPPIQGRKVALRLGGADARYFHQDHK